MGKGKFATRQLGNFTPSVQYTLQKELSRKNLRIKVKRGTSHVFYMTIPSPTRIKGNVAANHENDTCFGNGLVMGSADCINYAGLVNVNLALCQTHCRQVPVFSRLSEYHVITWSKSANHSCRHSFNLYFTHVSYPQFLPKGQYGLYFGYLVSGPLHLRSNKDRSPLRGHFWESLVFRLHSKLALKLSVTTTRKSNINSIG